MTPVTFFLPIVLFMTQSAPTQPAASAPANLLAGPSASESAEPLTIVSHNFDGSLQDVGPEPDFAAIGKLTLTDEQRNWYDTIHAQRLALFDRLVRSNYGMIVELASLQGETDRQKRVQALLKARDAFSEYFSRGSFSDEMKDYLTPAQRTTVSSMADEYQRAKTADARHIMGENTSAQGVAIHIRLEAFGRMIRESVERQVGLEREHFDHIAEELELTPEQKSKAEAIFQPMAVKRFQGMDVSEDRAAAFAEFNKILTPEQRRKALAMYLRDLQPQPGDAADSAGGTATMPATRPAMP